MDTHPTTQTRPLSQIYCYLVEGCNLACRHCWLAPQYDPQVQRTRVMPLDLLETALVEGKTIGLQGVKLTGGEPLLHPQIEQIFDLLQREHLGMTMETNGVLMTPHLAQRIAAFGGPLVSISLDGANAETHEWVRGVKGAFQSALNAVRYLVEAGVHPQIIFSVMHENVDQIADIVRLAESIGANSVKFNVIQPTARGKAINEKDTALSVEDYVRLSRYVQNEVAPTTPMMLHFDVPLAFRSLSLMAKGTGICGIKGIIGLLATGHYALCGIGEHMPEFVFGMAGTDSLAQVWNEHPVILAIRNGLPGELKGVCSRCLVSSACLGSCLAQNMYRTKDLFAPFWFCEDAELLGLFPASRLKLR